MNISGDFQPSLNGKWTVLYSASSVFLTKVYLHYIHPFMLLKTHKTRVVNPPESVLIQTINDGVSVIDDPHQLIHQLLLFLLVQRCFQMFYTHTNTFFVSLRLSFLFHVELCCPLKVSPGFSISLLSSCSTVGCCSSRSWVFPLQHKTQRISHYLLPSLRGVCFQPSVEISKIA